MTPTATDDLPADLVERVNALSQVAEGKLLDLLVGEDDEVSNEPMQYATEAIRIAWKEEIARRIAAYQRGELETMTVEECLAALEADQVAEERNASLDEPVVLLANLSNTSSR